MALALTQLLRPRGSLPSPLRVAFLSLAQRGFAGTWFQAAELASDDGEEPCLLPPTPGVLSLD